MVSSGCLDKGLGLGIDKYFGVNYSLGDKESINRLESVQRHFLSRISSSEDLNYWQKLKQFKVYSKER